jgi:hypothetical protein
VSDTPRDPDRDDDFGPDWSARDDAAGSVSPAGPGAAEAWATPAGPASEGRAAAESAGAGPAPAESATGGQVPAESAAGGQVPAESAAGGQVPDGAAGSAASRAAADGDPAGAASPGDGSSAQPGTAPGRASRRRFGRPLFGWATAPSGPLDERQRRRRQWFVAAISIGAAIIVIALCAGTLSVVSAINGVRDRAAEARESRHQRDLGCLDLEKRLNRLTPPGAATGPAARATAVRDENAAVRIYVGELRDQGSQDAWRQLLDARTVYADALDRQAKSRTPAFFVAPRAADGRPVADELVDLSPAACAGPIRRLAAPDL